LDAFAEVNSLEEQRVAKPDSPTEVIGGRSNDCCFDGGDESIDMMSFSE
jgi:hypothetical protein